MSDGMHPDRGLEERLASAFEAMGPTEETQARVLERLRGDAGTAPPEQSVSLRVPRWRMLLPLAACLVLVALVLRATLPGRGSLEGPAAPLDFEEETGDSEGAYGDAAMAEGDGADPYMTEEEVEARAVDEQGMREESYEVVPEMPAPYPFVLLSSGEVLTTGDPCAPPATEVRESAHALSARDARTGPVCEVAEGRFVRFPGDETWYELLGD